MYHCQNNHYIPPNLADEAKGECPHEVSKGVVCGLPLADETNTGWKYYHPDPPAPVKEAEKGE